MKIGDVVKWRNNKELSNWDGDLNILGPEWFSHAVVVDLEAKLEWAEPDGLVVTVLWDGQIVDLPRSILTLHDDPNHLATLLKRREEAIKFKRVV